MARRFAKRNVTFSQTTLSTAGTGVNGGTITHSLLTAATAIGRPDGWSMNIRSQSASRIKIAALVTINNTVIRVRAAPNGTFVAITNQRGDVFVWVDHSIVK